MKRRREPKGLWTRAVAGSVREWNLARMRGRRIKRAAAKVRRELARQGHLRSSGGTAGDPAL